MPPLTSPLIKETPKMLELPDLTKPYPQNLVLAAMGCINPLKETRDIDTRFGDMCTSIDYDTEILPTLVIPTAFISQIAPQWASCFPFISIKNRLSVAAFPMNDPPIALPGTTGTLAEPILPTRHKPLLNTESIPYPGATPVAMASPTAVDSTPATTDPPDLVPEIDSGAIIFGINGVTITARSGPADRSSPRSAEEAPDLEFQGFVSGPPGQIADPKQTASLSPMRVSGITVGLENSVNNIPGQTFDPTAPASVINIIVSGKTVSINGPALTMNDHTFNLASNGLSIDGTLATSSTVPTKPSSSKSSLSKSRLVFSLEPDGTATSSSVVPSTTKKGSGVINLTPSITFSCLMWAALYLVT
jgi:hypothetical protein